ncbi:MAG: hypothetical protein V7739_09740 [Motiliproteus sp.]
MNNERICYSRLLAQIFVLSLLFGPPPAFAHHVLGRPAYSLDEESNTPPSAVVETKVGDYLVTYMVFPAFPQPHEPGRVNLYASHIESGELFDGEITFIAQNDSWFNTDKVPLGTQVIDDGVYRQSFVFDENGDYTISATFVAQGHDYAMDFPLRIGDPPAIGPLGVIVALVASGLVGLSLWRRKRLIRDKIFTSSRNTS